MSSDKNRFRLLWHKVTARLEGQLNDHCETLLEVDENDFLNEGTNEQVIEKVREAMLYRLESIIEVERGGDETVDQAKDLLGL